MGNEYFLCTGHSNKTMQCDYCLLQTLTHTKKVMNVNILIIKTVWTVIEAFCK